MHLLKRYVLTYFSVDRSLKVKEHFQKGVLLYNCAKHLISTLSPFEIDFFSFIPPARKVAPHLKYKDKEKMFIYIYCTLLYVDSYRGACHR